MYANALPIPRGCNNCHSRQLADGRTRWSFCPEHLPQLADFAAQLRGATSPAGGAFKVEVEERAITFGTPR